jgi:hypothetical protein
VLQPENAGEDNQIDFAIKRNEGSFGKNHEFSRIMQGK